MKDQKNKKTEAAAFSAAGILLILAVIILVFTFRCDHDWQDANCETPIICTKCGKTKGDPLGHSWIPADCVTPSTCFVCKKQEGMALGHTPGDSVETIDIINAETIRTENCKICGQAIHTSRETLSSFAQDDLFIFSPREFLDRMTVAAKESFPDFHYQIDNNDGSIFADLTFDETDTMTYYITFHNQDTSMIRFADVDKRGVWGVCMAAMEAGTGGSVDPSQNYLSAEMIEAFCKTCDLTFSEDDLSSLITMKVTCHLNSLFFGEPIGYTECSGLYYEIDHFNLPEEAFGIQISSQSLVVYPCVW